MLLAEERERERELLSGVTGDSLLYGLTKNIPLYAGSSFLTFPFAGFSFTTFPFAGSSFTTRTKKITEFLTLSRLYFVGNRKIAGIFLFWTTD